jgi:uncharacterized caspase-like protein
MNRLRSIPALFDALATRFKSSQQRNSKIEKCGQAFKASIAGIFLLASSYSARASSISDVISDQSNSNQQNVMTLKVAQAIPGSKPNIPNPISVTRSAGATSMLTSMLTTLRSAVKSKQVIFNVTGDGVTTNKMRLNLTNTTALSLRLVVPQNEVFRSNSANVQTMMVTRDSLITLKPGAQIEVLLDTICASTKNMHPPPAGGVTFEMGAYPDKDSWTELSKIIAAARELNKKGAFKDVPIKDKLQTIQQYAVWMLLGQKSGDTKDLLTHDSIATDWTTELNEQVKHDSKLYSEFKEKGQLNAEGSIILDKKQKQSLDSRIDLILEATDLTIRRSKDSDLPGVAALPTDSTWDNLDQVGVRAFQKGDYVEAQELLEGAVKEAEKFGDTDVRLATSLTNLSRCLIEEGLAKEAEPQLNRALTIREKAGGKESIEYAATAGALGTAYALLNKPQDAEKYFQTALTIRQQKLGADHTEVAESLIDLGKLYCIQGKLDDAERLLKQALGIRYKAMGGESAAVADVNTDLAEVYTKQGKLPQAEKMYLKALAIDQKALGQDNAFNATILAGLAGVYKTMGKDQDAKTCSTTSDAIRQKALGANSTLLALLPNNYETITRVQTFATANESMEAGVKEIASSTDPKLIAAVQAEKRAKGSRTVRDKWALVIGISNYQDTSIQGLKYPAKDAKDFRDFLINNAHFAPDHVRLLTDDKATKKNIEECYGDKWLPRVAAPEDLVVLYFSGHGSPSQLDTEGINYLVAYDTNKDSLYATGIKIQDFTDQIKNRVHTDRMLLVMDACHSGAAESGAKGLFRAKNVSVDQIVQGSGQFVICSSQPNQVSWESKKYQNSVFTHFLIEGLKEKTKLGEACNYMKDKVQQEVLRDRGELQDPVVGSHWEGDDLVVGVVPAAPTPGLPEDKPVPNAAKTTDLASKSLNKGAPAKGTAAKDTAVKGTAAKGAVAKKRSG